MTMTSAAVGTDSYLYFAGEKQVADSSVSIDVISPATESLIGRITDSSPVDVDHAVQAAKRAFRESGWAQLSMSERARYIRALSAGTSRRGEEIAAMVTSQNGSPIWFSAFANSVVPTDVYTFFADLAETLEVEELRPAPDGTETIVRHEPYGVVALIIPWNGPHAMIASKVAPALLAGNTVVLKPSPETTLDIRLFWEAVKESGIPDGVINIVPGGRDTGMALVTHPDVAAVAFTGSTRAGREIGAACGQALKPVALELGGKSAAIILDDCDLDLFAEAVSIVCMPNSGQACYSNTRILAPAHRYEEVVQSVVGAVGSLTVGDPMDPTSVIGPMATANQRQRVLGYIESGRAEGARVAIGGGSPGHLPTGFYVEPTVFADVDSRMKIAQEEIFGPVLCVLPYQDVDDAVRIANDTPYGLGGAVYGADVQRARDVARRVETGTIGVNRYQIAMNAPFGGYKASGLGRELGPEGIFDFMQIKSIYV